MAEGFENLDNILHDWAKEMVLKVFSIHWAGTRSRKKKEKAVSFLDNDSEKILEQSQLASETEPNTKLVLTLTSF